MYIFLSPYQHGRLSGINPVIISRGKVDTSGAVLTYPDKLMIFERKRIKLLGNQADLEVLVKPVNHYEVPNLIILDGYFGIIAFVVINIGGHQRVGKKIRAALYIAVGRTVFITVIDMRILANGAVIKFNGIRKGKRMEKRIICQILGTGGFNKEHTADQPPQRPQ